MWLIPIQAECYAGSRADESPRRFCRESEWIEVLEIVDRWHQVESLPEWPRADYFKIRGDDGRLYLIKHDLEVDQWYLGRQWPDRESKTEIPDPGFGLGGPANRRPGTQS